MTKVPPEHSLTLGSEGALNGKNGKLAPWILIVLTVLALIGSTLAWTNSTFETKREAEFKFNVLEKKLDRILDRL
jgi:hypothetical protein